MADTTAIAIYKMGLDTQDYVRGAAAAKQSTDAVVASAEKLATTEEKVSRATRTSGDELSKLAARYDQRIKLEQRLANEQARMARLEREGIGSPEERARVSSLVETSLRRQIADLDKQEAAMRKSATTTGLARHEMINLSRQIQDVGVSLAGGQSPFRILIEQGSQIADIFASSKATVGDFFRSIGAGIGRLGSGAVLTGIVSGIAAIGGTIIAAASSFGSAQRDIQQSLLGIGRAAGVTSRDIQGIAEMSATTFGASISEAREFAAALAQSGTLGNAAIRDLTLVSKELAQVLGTDVAGAGKQLQQIFIDPVAGLQRLDKEMGTFDRGVAHNVETLKAQGKVFEASEVAAKALVDRMKELGPEIQRTTSFWTAFGNVASDIWDKLGKFAARRFGFGLSIEEELERAERALNDANQFFQQTGLGREMLDEAVTNFNRVTKIIETMGKSMEDIRRSRDVGAAKSIVGDVISDIANIEKLKNQVEGLSGILQRMGVDSKFADELQRAGVAAKNVELALKRVEGASQSYLNAQERLTAQFELQMQSINARTNAERIALAGKQQEVAMAGQLLTSEERRLEIARAQTLEAERQAQAHRDNMGALQDQLRIAQARTEVEQLSAQYEADINARLREGATLMQAEEEAAIKRKIAEEGIAKRREEGVKRALEDEKRITAERRAQAEAERQAMLELGKRLRESLQIASTWEELWAKLSTVGTGVAKVSFSAGTGFAKPGDVVHTQVGGGGPLVGAAGAGTAYNIDIVGRNAVTALLQKQADLQEKNAEAIRELARAQTPGSDEYIRAAEEAARAQQEAAAAAKEAAEAQIEAAKAAREAYISQLDDAVADIVATKLLAGQSAQAVNMLIETGAIQFGTASTRFQTQLDLYKRAGASNAQTAADIRAGIIGEGARPSELLAALDSLTDAVDANTDAQLGLSPFYTSQGDRQLGYRGYTVQRGASNIPGTVGGVVAPPTTGTGGVIGGMGGVVNPPGQAAAEFQGGGTGAIYPEGTIRTSLQGNEYVSYRLTNGLWIEISRTPRTGPTGGVRAYAEGGIIDRPQMAMVGEAGPEAFVPLKGGAIPVRLVGNAANQNRPPNVVNINAPLINFMAEPTRDEVRQSAFQAAQMLRRVATG